VDEDGRLVATLNPPIKPMTIDDLLRFIDQHRGERRADAPSGRPPSGSPTATGPIPDH
jgi:hypothetical protein